MADDLLIETVQYILSQQYDRNDIKTLCKIQFLDYADDYDCLNYAVHRSLWIN